VQAEPEGRIMAVEAQDERLVLAQAVARRICHDLAGLLGTLGGTLELIGEEPDAADLAGETAAVLTARVRLLRGAWGGGVEALDQSAIAALMPGLPGFERLQLNCAALTQPLEGAAARLCLCLLLVGAAGLPKGGTLVLGGHEAAIWLELQGPGAEWPHVLSEDAQSTWAEADLPRGLPAALCRLLAEAAGWTLSVAGVRVSAAVG
jgi:histidine phosphotransferase ChpT